MFQLRYSIFLVLVICSGQLASHGGELPQPQAGYVATKTFAVPDATQAAAADEKHFYAVSNTRVVQFDRTTGKETARSDGPAKHLNSAFLWEGKVYCAHSNYPAVPHESDIRVWDLSTKKLTIFHRFEQPAGSLTWAILHEDSWWCHFAHYKEENAKSVVIRYSKAWKELQRWTYPTELVAEWDGASLSGGIWHDGKLLTTGHDKKLIYHVELPTNRTTAVVKAIYTCPWEGQGIARDPKTGGLVGIIRSKREVVFAQLKREKR
ncbi:MAG: endonuclease [Zavarzinella sp.]